MPTHSSQAQLAPTTDFDLICQELDRLFLFQDKPLPKEKRASLADELLRTCMPIGAILKGISSLAMEELSSIKMSILLSAIRKFIEPEAESNSCPHCLHGIVLMRDSSGYQKAVACFCDIGKYRSNRLGLKIWNGDNIMGDLRLQSLC